MDDVIDLLRENNQSVPVPLELPDEDSLVLIEEELYLSLPADYREFLLTVSDVVCGSLEPSTVTDPRAHTYLPEVAAQAWNEGLPRHYIPICACPEGYYCIAEEGKVYFWSDGSASEADEWPTIWHWAEEVWLKS